MTKWYVHGRHLFIMESVETCAFHFEHDAAGEPVGAPCGAPVTHVILWDDCRYSPCCAPHGEREVFTPEAWGRVVEVVPVGDLRAITNG